MTTQNLRVALVWNGTIFQEKMTRSGSVKVGDSRTNDFCVPAQGLPEQFEMFRASGSSYSLRFSDALTGKARIGGQEYTLDELIKANKANKAGSEGTAGGGNAAIFEAAIGESDWGVVNLGEASFFFQFVDPNVAVLAKNRTPLDLTLFGTVGAAAFTHFMFLVFAVWSYDPNIRRADLTLPDRFVKFIAQEPPDPVEEVEEVVEEPEEDTTGKKAGGEEGKFGDKDSDIEDSIVPKVDGEMVDKIDVKNLGINKALGSNLLGAGPLKNIFGNAEGFDSKMNVAMSGEGNVLVVGRGAGGMGMRGTGTGGGGEGFGRIHGLGKVDTGGGKGVNAKIGGKGKAKVEAKVSKGAASVGQFCAKSNIQSVVGRGSSAIKYCFESELQLNPSLAGKVTLNWTVGLDGGVIKPYVASSTMGNAKVESCMIRVVQRWRFDPPSGGLCSISYPFTFSGAGE